MKLNRRALLALSALVLWFALVPAASAQVPTGATGSTPTESGVPAIETGSELPLAGVVGQGLLGADGAELVAGAAAGGEEGGSLSTAVEIAVLLTALSLLPAILITVTSFTRIVIVLSFVRRSLSVNELPPNPVIIGLALFLTTFIMAPVAGRIHERAYVPYDAGALTGEEARDVAWEELSGFLVANTRESELALFLDLASGAEPGDETPEPEGAAELPMRVVVPAFVLSELKTAFQMGFLLFLPFLVIDLIVSSVLLSMGMFMLPPVMVSTPFKILLFVLVDGWHLVCQSLVGSFLVT
jgi:flagellar biosynthetic protein FliP